MHDKHRCMCSLQSCNNKENSQMQVFCSLRFTGCLKGTLALCTDTPTVHCLLRKHEDLSWFAASCQLQVWLCFYNHSAWEAGRRIHGVCWRASLTNLVNSRFSERSSYWIVKNSWRRYLMSTSDLRMHGCTPVHAPAYIQLLGSCSCLQHVTTVLWVHEWHSNAMSGTKCFTTLFYILP